MTNRYLLDTHYLIWIMKNPHNIKNEVIKIIENKDNIIFVSQVSLWEIAIKQKIGKIELLDSLENFKKDIIKNDFVWLNIKDAHIFETLNLQLFEAHRDPFDRMIIAQAKIENLIIISDDAKFKLYDEIIIV